MEVDDFPKLLSVEEWSRMLIDTANPAKADPRLPALPAEDLQKLTNNLAGEMTLKAAAVIYANMASLITKYIADPEDIKILDFGCGWGRITRFLPQLTSPDNIYGVDVDERLIQACKDYLAPMHFETIVSGKPLSFADQSFDVVISNSVYSHLSESSHRFYVGQMARIIRPGGLFLGTTLSEGKMKALYDDTDTVEWITGITGSRESVEAALERGEFVFRSTGRWTDYGIAFIPDGWTRDNWKPEFEVIDFVMGDQTINVARRI